MSLTTATMSYIHKCLCLFVIYFISSSQSAPKKIHLPDYIKVCKRYDPNLSECIKNVVEAIKPHLPKGIPEMQIPPAEPLFITKVELDTGRTFKATFENLNVHHATDFKLLDVKMDTEKNSGNLHLFFPLMRMITDYKIQGRLLILDLNGEGKADGNLTNIDAKVSFNGKRTMKNGKEYINFDENKITIDVGPSTLRFDDLFKDNKELTDTTNQVINDNIGEIITELKPIIEQTIASVVFGITSNVFRIFPLDTLLPVD